MKRVLLAFVAIFCFVAAANAATSMSGTEASSVVQALTTSGVLKSSGFADRQVSYDVTAKTCTLQAMLPSGGVMFTCGNSVVSSDQNSLGLAKDLVTSGFMKKVAQTSFFQVFEVQVTQCQFSTAAGTLDCQ